jgi:hypothetical protein
MKMSSDDFFHWYIKIPSFFRALPGPLFGLLNHFEKTGQKSFTARALKEAEGVSGW